MKIKYVEIFTFGLHVATVLKTVPHCAYACAVCIDSFYMHIIYIHSMYKKVLIGWLLLFCRRLFITALFFYRIAIFLYQTKTNMKPVNKCNYLISSVLFQYVLFFLLSFSLSTSVYCLNLFSLQWRYFCFVFHRLNSILFVI